MARRRYVLKPRAKLMIAVLVVGYFIFTFIQQELKIREQHAQMEHLRQQIQQVEEYNAELERQIEYTKSEEYIEKAARERFGWVKKGEIKFIEKQN
ncbi:septum formation initiator family protein [Caldicoprobacter algeriensis]|uniref:FtsB family cell division protein n=1 Tax=Caldicoprobacter algeriensis TaxID=699281 RepID=UPI0020796FBA|nr:septum formation initiator family protein [Caldicoprobacter algeriensis]MCM8901866.1 septum formation initiator family protein [Caldicoprobacter algeriensis]